MIITVDVLKKINGAIAKGEPLSLSQVADECSLDAKMLSLVAGDLSQKITGMRSFFTTMQLYLVEMDKRVKRLEAKYKEIQSLQIASGMIEATGTMSDPPLEWQ